MILDAYIPTRTPHAIELRVVSRSESGISVVFDAQERFLASPDIAHESLFFFRTRWGELEPDTTLSLTIRQEGHPKPIELKTGTLPLPNAQRRVRFGLLPDTHLDVRQRNVPERIDRGKRIYSKATELTRKYVQRINELGADFIILPGDLMDPASAENCDLLRGLFDESSIPCYPIIGNHEEWGGGSRQRFYTAFDMPEHGYYAFDAGDNRFILLDTPYQDCLDSGSPQLAWLKGELAAHASTKNTLLFGHFSLILHPCVQGWKNDGLQQIWNYREVMDLLKQYPKVRAFIAGHKNVPSRILVDGIAHMLCPQLIQSPCSFDIIDLYADAMMKSVYEIEEQHYAQASRRHFETNWHERYGTEESRNFTWFYDAAV